MLALFGVWAALAAVLTVSDRSEVRARAPGSAPPTTSLDVETAPELRLALASRRMRYTLAYTPRLTLWDVNVTGVRPELLHGAGARIEWTGRHSRLSLDETASYGGVNFSALAPAPGPDGTPPTVDAVPAPRVVDFISWSSMLASHLSFRRWASDFSVGYQLAGGATADSRDVLPFQSGPFAEAGVTHNLSRVDDLSLTIAGSEASFSTGSESLLVEADPGWRHLWSRVTETRLALGVSEARVRASSDAPHTFETYPVAEGILEQHLPSDDGRVDLRLGVRLGPVVNRLLGLVDERVQGTFALTRTSGRFASHAYLGAAQSVPAAAAGATRLVSGELGVAYGTSEAVTFDLGVRGFWQRRDPALADLLQGTVFVGLTLRAPPMRL